MREGIEGELPSPDGSVAELFRPAREPVFPDEFRPSPRTVPAAAGREHLPKESYLHRFGSVCSSLEARIHEAFCF